MGLQGECLVCGVGGCGCRAAFTRFLSLIYKADQRVSSHKDTSSRPEIIAVGIDKLGLELKHPLSRDEVIRRLEGSRHTFKLTRLRNKGWHVPVGQTTKGTYLALRGRDSVAVSRLFTRPAAFHSFEDCSGWLRTFLTDGELNAASLTRLDLCIDYREPLQDILRGLDIGQKQCRTSFTDKGAVRTGVLVGIGNEKIVIYDKALESGVQAPLTRIEIQLSGAKLPVRTFSDLPAALQTPTWNPFSKITLNTVAYLDAIHREPHEQERLSQLRAVLDREGLFSARRTLNCHGNFWRDYGHLFQITPRRRQPMDHFSERIALFLKHGGDNGKNRETEAGQP